METLTAPLLQELIDRIEVHEVEGRGKDRTQRIVIYYRFAGYLDLPMADPVSENTRKGVAVSYLPKALPAQRNKKSGDNWNQLSPLEMVAGEGLALACGLGQGTALNAHRAFIHHRALQVLLRTRDIKMTHRMAGHFYMVAGEGLALACGLGQGTALNAHRAFIHHRALQVLL